MGPREVPPPLPDLEANDREQRIRSRSRCCTATATGCRAWRARWTRCTPPSCTAAPASLRQEQPKSLRLLPLPRTRAAIHRPRHGVRHVLRRLPPRRGRQLLLAHRPTCSSPSTPCSRRARSGENAKLNAYVPMDDENTLQWEVPRRDDRLKPPSAASAVAVSTRYLPTSPTGTAASTSSRRWRTTT